MASPDVSGRRRGAEMNEAVFAVGAGLSSPRQIGPSQAPDCAGVDADQLAEFRLRESVLLAGRTDLAGEVSGRHATGGRGR